MAIVIWQTVTISDDWLVKTGRTHSDLDILLSSHPSLRDRRETGDLSFLFLRQKQDDRQRDHTAGQGENTKGSANAARLS